MISLEFCAGAGGQALGLEQAGFEHAALVEIDADCCKTLSLNRPMWTVLNQDMNLFDSRIYRGVDLVAGGLPCPPFSVAGKQLGAADERNLFPAALRIVDEVQPKAIMIENVKGFLSPVFQQYREFLKTSFEKMGYIIDWKLLNASEFGVPQLRPRVVIVALRPDVADRFSWPVTIRQNLATVGSTLKDMMASNGWLGATGWAERANGIAPTIVGGSKKHGGPDLGPTRARNAWAQLGVNGKSIAEHPPHPDFVGMPRLTVEMVARLQGFPADWRFYGRKTAAYRQVGNAFPPPVARSVASGIHEAIAGRRLVAVG